MQRHDYGINTRGAVADLFTNFDEVIQGENRVKEVAISALEQCDEFLHQNSIEGLGGDLSGHEESKPSNGQSNHFEENCKTNSNFQTGVHIREDEDSTGEEEQMEDIVALDSSMKLLHSGSPLTQLGATMMFMNLKATHATMTDPLPDDILSTFKHMLPEDHCLPGSISEMRTLTDLLGLDYFSITFMVVLEIFIIKMILVARIQV